MLKFEKNKRQEANGTIKGNTPDLPEKMPDDRAEASVRISSEQLSGVTGGSGGTIMRPGDPVPPHKP